MKMTKRLATLAACAVMAASSMVGMGAFAAEDKTSTDSNSTIVTYADGIFNTSHTGAYYNGTSSFINITGTSSSDAECIFVNVSFDEKNIYGVTSTFSIGTAGKKFTATFASGKWFYYVNGSKVTGTEQLRVEGEYDGGIITINNKDYSR